MKITSILTEDLIQVNVPGESKDDVINAVIDLAAKSQKIKDIDKVRHAIFEREKIMSTGVGKGFAIPHGKTDAVSDIVAAFATLRQKRSRAVAGAYCRGMLFTIEMTATFDFRLVRSSWDPIYRECSWIEAA